VTNRHILYVTTIHSMFSSQVYFWIYFKFIHFTNVKEIINLLIGKITTSPWWKSIQPSPILLLAHHKLQFHYLMGDLHGNFSTPITSKENQQKCIRPEFEGSRAKRYCKNSCERVDCDQRNSRWPTGPVRTRLIARCRWRWKDGSVVYSSFI